MKLSDEQLLLMLRNRLSQKKSDDNGEHKMFMELQAVSNKLKQSEQLKSNFLSNIRNEINNPISSVLGLSKLMLSAGQNDKDQMKRHAFLIHNEIFQLDFQMRNIFAAAEIEAGEKSVEPTRVDVRKLIDETVEAIKFKADQKSIDIITSYQTDELDIYTDGYMLSMIMMNLFTNAIEYSFNENEVIITAVTVGDKLIVSVKDNGMGIDRSDQPKIFERFYQLEGGTTKQHTGHGLGLSVTKELIECLSGSLSVKSAKGKGSIFSVSIPSLERKQFTPTRSENWNEFLFNNHQAL
jgi:signal transduction histidine kinase